MYYTANTADGATHCLGAATSPNVEGPYQPLPNTLGDCPREYVPLFRFGRPLTYLHTTIAEEAPSIRPDL